MLHEKELIIAWRLYRFGVDADDVSHTHCKHILKSITDMFSLQFVHCSLIHKVQTNRKLQFEEPKKNHSKKFFQFASYLITICSNHASSLPIDELLLDKAVNYEQVIIASPYAKIDISLDEHYDFLRCKLIKFHFIVL